MHSVTVERGQGLHSIARNQLPKGASAATIQQAVQDIARANGLAPDAKLKLHQTLVIPDTFAGVTTSSAANEAVSRLSQPTSGASVLNARLAASTQPMVPFAPRFSETVRTPIGPVELPDIAGKQVQGELQKFEGTRSYIGDAAENTIDARLGKLTRAEFAAVHAELGGRSGVAFDPARDYRVADFLPPALQALVNQDFETPETVTLKGSKKLIKDFGPNPDDLVVGLTTNCHATAWEAVRAYQGAGESVALFYGEMITMDDLTHDDKRFAKVGEVDAAHLPELTRLDLKPGDIVQFHEINDWARMTMLLHSATYVGGGLFFEKPNTEGPEKSDPAKYISQDETPYRLIDLNGMAAPVSQAVDGKFRVEVLRAKAPLEDPMQVFGSELTEPLDKWAQKKGRPLGVELVTEIEQGIGGGIHSIGVSALVRNPLVTRDDGTSALG